MSKPLVSVCIITYNQESYIRQAIESVLMQKVNFPWEIIIADDCSKDKTREIILEYKDRFPDLIKPLFQKRNVGGGKNFTDLINAATGKYVAYLEGDDYWTDDGKLQLAAYKGWGKCGIALGSMSPPRLSRGSERRDPQPHPTVEIAWTFMSSRTS